jgi:hypothetical protein
MSHLSRPMSASRSLGGSRARRFSVVLALAALLALAASGTAAAASVPWHGEQWVDCDNESGYDELWIGDPAVGILPGAPYGAQQKVRWEPVYFRLVGGVWTYYTQGPWHYTTANAVYTRRWTDAAGASTLYAHLAPVPAGNRWRVAAQIYWYPTAGLPSATYYDWIDSHHTQWSPHRPVDMGMNDIDTWGSSCYLP